MRSDPSAYAIRFQQVLFGLALLVLGLMATVSMMRGHLGNIRMMALTISLATVVLLMDRHYWLMWPLMSWGRELISIPPFDAPEIGCIMVIGVHFVRRALRQERDSVFRPAVLLAAPYMVWAAISFIMNPTGIFLLGSRMIGARFYARMVLAFCAMIVLSLQRLDERDCRNLFSTAVILTSLTLLKGAAARQVAASDVTGSATPYELLGAASLYALLFCRWRLSALLQISWRPIAAVVLAALTVYTGKRRAVFNVGVIPLLRALVTRQDRGTAVFLSLLAACLLSLVVLGQGRLYELPFSVQRGLSMLPGRWSERLKTFELGQDPFRENVRRYAWEEVRRNPWFGRKGLAIDLEEVRWVNDTSALRDYEGHAVAGNWHNTWVGMMADFGIPGAVFWGLFSVAMLVVGSMSLRRCADGSYQQTVLTYLVVTYWLTMFASHTSGHSALLPYQHWPLFGLLLAITPADKSGRFERLTLTSGNSISPGGVECSRSP